MSRPKHTVEKIVERFDEAVETLRALKVSGIRPAQMKSGHPEVVRQIYESYGYTESVLKLPPPSAAAITRMYEVWGWSNSHMSEFERRVVWAVACGFRWAKIGRSLMISRHEAKKSWTKAIVRLMFKLNGVPEREIPPATRPRRRLSAAHRVYFIEGPGGLVKIGTSLGVADRLKALQTGSPTPLRLIGDITGDTTTERQIHKHFAKYRRHGEWFACLPQIKTLLKEIDRGTPMHIALDVVEPLARRAELA